MTDKVRRAYPPPVKCRATSKRTGRRCGRWAVPGNVVCVNHGAAGGPHGGRKAAEQLHAVRRTEALVTAEVNAQMAAQGWSPALLDAISDAPPRFPRPHDGPADDLVRDEDEERALEASMRRMAETIAEKFTGALVGSLRPTAPAPAVIPGEIVPEPDPLAEDIARLEARPTPKRQAEAARLRQVHDGPALPAPSVTAEPPSEDSKVTGPAAEPAPEPPREARPRRTTTRLGYSGRSV